MISGHSRRRAIDRRRLLTAAGFVAFGVTTAGAARAADRDPKLSPTARTAVPGETPLPYDVRVIYRAAPRQRLIALTIDDGPTTTWTPAMLAMLAQHRAKATFFIVGERLAAAPELGRAAVHAGHQLGNHTWAHSDLTTHSQRSIGESLRRTHQVIAEVTGRAPRVLRPPWGRIDSVGLLVCSELGYDVVLWSEHVSGTNAAADAATTVRQATPGSIVLAHDGGSEASRKLIRVLDQMIGVLRSKGFTFVTIDELLAATVRSDRSRQPG